MVGCMMYIQTRRRRGKAKSKKQWEETTQRSRVVCALFTRSVKYQKNTHTLRLCLLNGVGDTYILRESCKNQWPNKQTHANTAQTATKYKWINECSKERKKKRLIYSKEISIVCIRFALFFLCIFSKCVLSCLLNSLCLRNENEKKTTKTQQQFKKATWKWVQIYGNLR